MPYCITSLSSSLSFDHYHHLIIIINHYCLGKIDMNDLMLSKPGVYDPWLAYGNSKQANILFTREMARRLASSSSTSTKTNTVIPLTCHPGVRPATLQYTNVSLISSYHHIEFISISCCCVCMMTTMMTVHGHGYLSIYPLYFTMLYSNNIRRMSNGARPLSAGSQCGKEHTAVLDASAGSCRVTHR